MIENDHVAFESMLTVVTRNPSPLQGALAKGCPGWWFLRNLQKHLGPKALCWYLLLGPKALLAAGYWISADEVLQPQTYTTRGLTRQLAHQACGLGGDRPKAEGVPSWCVGTSVSRYSQDGAFLLHTDTTYFLSKKLVKVRVRQRLDNVMLSKGLGSMLSKLRFRCYFTAFRNSSRELHERWWHIC